MDGSQKAESTEFAQQILEKGTGTFNASTNRCPALNQRTWLSAQVNERTDIKRVFPTGTCENQNNTSFGVFCMPAVAYIAVFLSSRSWNSLNLLPLSSSSRFSGSTALSAISRPDLFNRTREATQPRAL
jgi:hypothetical protein